MPKTEPQAVTSIPLAIVYFREGVVPPSGSPTNAVTHLMVDGVGPEAGHELTIYVRPFPHLVAHHVATGSEREYPMQVVQSWQRLGASAAKDAAE